MSIEKSLIILKPDAVKRGLVGEILARFERRGITIEQLKSMTITDKISDQHYSEHVNKPFYPNLKDYITSGPVIVGVLKGKNVIAIIRKTVGATNCAEADPGTIRGDLGIGITENMIHASDSVESAEKEIKLYF